MKRKSKIIGSLILFLFLIIIANTVKVQAASTSITGSKTVTQGEVVTITGSVTAGGWNLTLSGAGQSKHLVGQTSVTGNDSASTSITFTASDVGTYTFTLKGDITDFDTDVTSNVNKPCTITVKAPSTGVNTGTNTGDSTNNGGSTSSGSENTSTNTSASTAQLKMITTKPVDFSGFKSASTGPYKVTVENNVTSIDVVTSKKDGGQKVSISGNQNLDVGTNKVTVSVTSADGKNKMTYVIYVTRKSGDSENTEEKPNQIDNENNKEEKEKLGLSAIILDEGYSLTPEFKTDIYEYTVNINEDLKEFPVNAISTQDDAKIEITGNTDLIDGENTITIKVISADGNETVVYTIKVIKEKIETTQIEKKIQATPTYYNAYESIKNTSMIVTVIIGIVFFVATTSAIAEFRTYSKKLNVCKLEKTSKDNFNYGETIGEVNIEEVKPKKHKGKHF